MKMLVALGVLTLAGAGSATLLNSYGTISGTADVEPALEIGDVGETSIEVKKNLEGEFNSQAEIEANGSVESVGVITSDSKEISFSEDVLKGSYDVKLRIENREIESKQVSKK
mgnify:FL=1